MSRDRAQIQSILPVLAAFFFSRPICAAGQTYQQSYRGTPYEDSHYKGGAQVVPGIVACAYYDRGGEGVAYHDTTVKNEGSGGLNPADGTYLNEFRMSEAVDTSYTKFRDQIDNNPYDLVQPPENQLYVGWTQPGEWFNVSVMVPRAGIYIADLLYTSNRGGTISLDVNCLLYTSPSPRDGLLSRMPSSA